MKRAPDAERCAARRSSASRSSLIAVLGNALASPADLRVVVNFLIALVLVLAIQTFSGNSGIVTFGHVAFMGVGAYVAALAHHPAGDQGEPRCPTLPGFIADTARLRARRRCSRAWSAPIVASVVGHRAHPHGGERDGHGDDRRARDRVRRLRVLGRGSRAAPTGLFGIPRSTTIWWALAFAVVTIAIGRLFRESNPGLELRASREDCARRRGPRLERRAPALVGVGALGRADGRRRRRSGRSTTSPSGRGSSSSRRRSPCSR